MKVTSACRTESCSSGAISNRSFTMSMLVSESGDRVLDLHPRVDFHEIEVALLVEQELKVPALVHCTQRAASAGAPIFRRTLSVRAGDGDSSMSWWRRWTRHLRLSPR
ncbi:MAG: hypothetical protein R2708_26490 [Vicinamibacterales bacterium]